ncbi:NAD(P)/FAD-dependent oxidoreductase [Ponticaulis sp.]|uniref:NAD(P)/FAD-dependent oxidoreductase n=1 Tax=Ponticaulis sp. TaxID=2020902 RepID=UPI000B75AF0D|nr:NAD(P)/FAD-dependent oxidoreductase [Ponticaulis sp.]MAI90123.1 thioredoxin reductase [Ponticaulis sp.]OUY00277.1 MAG: thioredoxin reductase [Hyphomonadaceae bacterium TMED5]
MKYGVIIIGGSYSGMSAALQLARARQKILVLDGGKRRNRFADHSNGFLTQDGIAPDEIARTARQQLLAYPSVYWTDQMATDISGEKDHFTVSTDASERFHGKRIILAIGVSDTLPDVKGLQERWGQTVFHCPYCHGYELGQKDIAVIAVGENSVHQALMLPDWGATTFFTDGRLTLNDEMSAKLAHRGVEVEHTPIARITGSADVYLTDGRTLSFAGIFVASRNKPSTSLGEGLGCAIEETPFGTQLQTDANKETSIPGVFACGDVARVPHSVALAVADGAWAGASAHGTLIFG